MKITHHNISSVKGESQGLNWSRRWLVLNAYVGGTQSISTEERKKNELKRKRDLGHYYVKLFMNWWKERWWRKPFVNPNEKWGRRLSAGETKGLDSYRDGKPHKTSTQHSLHCTLHLKLVGHGTPLHRNWNLQYKRVGSLFINHNKVILQPCPLYDLCWFLHSFSFPTL